ncbi:MAG: hypothetical protein SVW77_02780 [Candidatus Nanohaloarchaea archaeon]|nr:hypothetical protein [Candidatus Nanohaloarchaea archaeon]
MDDIERTLRHEAGTAIQLLQAYEEHTDPFDRLLAYLDDDGGADPATLRAHADSISEIKRRYSAENWVRATEVMGTVSAVAGLKELQEEDPGDTQLYRVLNGLAYFDTVLPETGTVAGDVQGNDALWLAFHTIGKNFDDHVKRNDEDARLYAAVRETTDSYLVDVWDDGPGLDESVDEERFWEKDYGSQSGFGTYLIRSVVEQSGGSVTMYQQRRDWMPADADVGLGYEIELPRA